MMVSTGVDMDLRSEFKGSTMKSRFFRTVCTAVLMLVGALVAGNAGAAAPLRIMPLGDSITWGEPVPGGYRLPLWNLFA